MILIPSDMQSGRCYTHRNIQTYTSEWVIFICSIEIKKCLRGLDIELKGFSQIVMGTNISQGALLCCYLSNVIYFLFTCFQKSFSFSIWFQSNSLVDTSLLPSVWQQCQCNLTLPHSFLPSQFFSFYFTSFSVIRWISISFQTLAFFQWFCFGLASAAVDVPNVSEHHLM